MKNIFLWPVLLAITHATCAQSLSPSVVSPGGSFSSNGGYSLRRQPVNQAWLKHLLQVLQY
ncbi:MAG: hypothetical protein IPG90_06665 [Bacteroidetes bacterium]|nr:hypothetical protein [Bacteroidota bacterium]